MLSLTLLLLAFKSEVRPDLATQSVNGKTTITLKRSSPPAKLDFPIHELLIDRVELDARPAEYKVEHGNLSVWLPAQHGKTQQSELAISYHGKPTRGLYFGSNYVYSAFDSCYWMICQENSGDKYPFELHLIVPKIFRVVASGVAMSTRPESATLLRHVWKEARPYSPYLFGFAAGEFQETEQRVARTQLRYLSLRDDAASVLKKFQDTGRMLKFFEDKAGAPFPHPTYTQVLLPGDEAQEASSFSLLGHEVIDPILKDPQEDWAIAHELAHQWWGNLVTCKDWSHFWLNEGITVFMTAAYKQMRWGELAYARELELAKLRYQRAIDAGFDVPLSYAGTYPSLKIKRAIVYSKGMLFVDAVRKDLGEKIFWAGLRDFTQAYAGKTAESRDFQNAMERASKRNLGALFNQWVY